MNAHALLWHAPRRIVAWPAFHPAWRPIGWIALHAVAAWPVWQWTLARMGDGSDAPLGMLAFVALAGTVFAIRRDLDVPAHRGWAAAALGCVLVATWAGDALPMLARAVFAAGALACAIAAHAPHRPVLPLAGLAVLALPLIASLQFYAGYPLRVITAEASRPWLALAGASVERTGSALIVDGRLVLVDAPCSGVQMAWTAYFVACLVALVCALPDRRFLARLPWVGLAVLVANVVRNVILVAGETGLGPAAWHAHPAWHDAVGLGVLALLCVFVVWVLGRASDTSSRGMDAKIARSHANGDVTVRRSPLRAALLVCCAAWPAFVGTPPALAGAPHVEWPREYDGVALRPVALGAVEQRFADRFPGAIARFAAGDAVVVLRHVDTPTRRLHPARDCYMGLGYRVADERVERDAQGRLWRCFVATRDGRRVRVCERIASVDGASAHTDASSWYWDAMLGRSHGPWRAITIARPA